ncbi:MAG: aldo/keto reductase [Candidatus Solibacter sp.]|jgi:aryl-alcohol dehydrogenase-like predicted oxidoreductase|nr:aldo/keto reductase [Candidatus Solibacter sp.]
MNRRNFLRAGAAGVVSMRNFPHHLFAAAKPKNATDRIVLGPRKIELSRMAMGTGTSGSNGSSNQTRKLGYHGVSELFRAAYDQGINFWDSADQYGSHTYIREALKTVPRDKVVILTKTNSTTAAAVKADIDRYRREIGVDTIDILLLHNQQAADWNVRMRPCMDVITEAQDRGIIRSHGISCHTLQALKTSAAEPWVEVQLARLNPAGLHMDADPATVVSVLKQMKQAGKGVIGMKILAQGDLRTKADEALQFAMAQDCLDAITIGSESRAEMEDLLRKIPAASVRG